MTDGAVAKLLRLWQHASALWRHAVWIRIVTSHNAWMGYEYSLPNLNRPRAIHKHNPHPLETMGVCVVKWRSCQCQNVVKMTFPFECYEKHLWLRKLPFGIRFYGSVSYVLAFKMYSGILLWMRSANERRHHIVTLSRIHLKGSPVTSFWHKIYLRPVSEQGWGLLKLRLLIVP